MYFVTCHGTFLCLGEAGQILHRPAAEIRGIDDLLDIDIAMDTDGERFRRAMAAETGGRAAVVRSGPLAGHVVHLQANRRTAAISQNGQYVCTVPGVPLAEANREQANAWEMFACLTRQDAADLLFILGQRWILGSEGRILAPSDITMGTDYQLRLGTTAIDLRYNLPFAAETRGGPDGAILSATLLIDGWKIERLHLYRPMIFLTAFKAPEYLDQAALCISSLLEFGGYDGAIHIISDQPPETFLQRVPALSRDQLTVQPLVASDWLGYVASRYCILDWPAAHAHQPLLYLDNDVIADAPLAPLLTAVVTTGRISAPMEDFSRLSSSPSVGASLIQMAGLTPRFACGFNNGTIGIPNLAAHGEILRLIRTIIANHTELHGRDALRWVDQEIANYVSFAIGNFDSATLLRYIRFGWEGAEHDPTRRLGLVHFFPPRGPVGKSEAMQIYTDTLRAAGA